MKEIYKVSGNEKIGFRLIVPVRARPRKAYYFEVRQDGTLVYRPVV
jgi:hypothetical protein